MGCKCCGGPLVGGTGFCTSVKYHGATGKVMWWTDSGQNRNVGQYHDGVYYELAGPTSVTTGTQCFLRALDSGNGAELLRHDYGASRSPAQVAIIKGGVFVCLFASGARVIHKVNLTDLSSTWTFSNSISNTFPANPMFEGDLVIIPATEF